MLPLIECIVNTASPLSPLAGAHAEGCFQVGEVIICKVPSACYLLFKGEIKWAEKGR